MVVERYWIASFIVPTESGGTTVVTRRIKAPDAETARAFAAETPPDPEFILTLHPETDEQYLNQVGQEAARRAEEARKN